MLNGLRLRLSLLYLLASCVAITLLGATVYAQVKQSLEHSAELAMGHKLARALLEMSEPLPSNLKEIDRAWYISRGQTPAPQTPHPTTSESDEHSNNPLSMLDEADSFDAELSPIFLAAMDPAGEPAVIGGSLPAGAASLETGLQAADRTGFDTRSVTDSNGDRMEWMAARVSGSRGVVSVLAGRSMADVDRLLQNLLSRFLAVGLGVTVALGIACWWLAGRSLRSAQESWEKQREFIANASHELRAPLTLLRMSAELARRKTAEADERHTLLSDVLTETDHMSRLVADLLLLSRLDAGSLNVDCVPTDLSVLVESVGREIQRVAQEKNVALSIESNPGCALGDPVRIRQVLLILLDNALQHTPPEGRIHLVARVDDAAHLIVEDTGSGIPIKDLPHIFNRFFRAGGARDGGSGLGLSIARAMVKAMHGHIAVTNRPGGGTLAEVTLEAVGKSSPRTS
jgi:signal transduction histidine kinase